MSEFTGATLMITGGTGSFGNTVLKHFLTTDIGQIRIFSQDEKKQDESPDGETHRLTGTQRRLFAYVPQGNQLMHGTIRQIVSFAAPEAAHDEERLQKALTVACAEEFVAELDQGADTQLGERGTGLSEGQMQRLAIARAIFSGSPILLLDEATSALDEETESRLLHNLRGMTDKTVIIVSHRRAALNFCDRVISISEDGVLS